MALIWRTNFVYGQNQLEWFPFTKFIFKIAIFERTSRIDYYCGKCQYYGWETSPPDHLEGDCQVTYLR